MKSLLSALLLLAAPAAAEVRSEHFNAASLGRDVTYSIQLPPSYAKGTARYPVLYVLHGLFEGPGFWEQRGLAAQLDELWGQGGGLPEFLVVAVDGGNSFFANSRLGRFEDLVTHDLIAEVESRYRAIPNRDARGLIGVSMGGYAALRIAFTHPEVFRVVATHSAMLLEKPPTQEEGARRGQMAAFHDVFGDPIDAAQWTANDPLVLVDKVEAKSAPLLSIDCGSEDRYGLFRGNEELHRKLQARGVAHEFRLAPGNHGYEYVKTVLPASLRFVATGFSAAVAAETKGSGKTPAHAQPHR
jgi:S-formylglutathione hydrolase FrmB